MQSSLNLILREAKIRLWWIFLCFISTCCYSYWYSEYLLFVLIQPFLRVSQPNSIFLCTQLTESLNTFITTSCSLGFFFWTPYLIYQIWCFVIPSCNITQRAQVRKFCILSAFAFLFIFLLTYALIMPNIWFFLYNLNFAQTNSQNLLIIKLQPKIYDFIVLTLRFFFIASFCSQLPVAIIYCIESHLISVQNCIRHRKTFLLFSALLAALISPPDIWCQLAAWIPIYTLIEFTILTSLIQIQYKNCSVSAAPQPTTPQSIYPNGSLPAELSDPSISNDSVRKSINNTS